MNEFDINKKPESGSGFKTPEGYFDDFSSKMLQKIAAEETKVVPIFSKPTRWIYAAAAVLLVSLSVPVYNRLSVAPAELDAATLENYLATRNTISEADFAELLDENDIQQIKIDSDIESKTIEDLLSTNANLEEYLIN